MDHKDMHWKLLTKAFNSELKDILYQQYFGAQFIAMSGYLGSIGFAFQAAQGARAATRGERPVVAAAGTLNRLNQCCSTGLMK